VGPFRGINVTAPFFARHRAAIGIRRDQARIDCETSAADQTCVVAGCDDALKHTAEAIIFAEAFVASARESRVIGDLISDAEAAESAIGEIKMHLAAQRALRADRENVAKGEHPDHKLRID
jgi:hypothetical protein